MKKSLLAGVLTLGLLGSSCLGPNNAFDSLTHWNRGATDSKWLDELIFLGLNIIPVYGLALIGDYLIFNSFEFWGAENPIDPPPAD